MKGITACVLCVSYSCTVGVPYMCVCGGGLSSHQSFSVELENKLKRKDKLAVHGPCIKVHVSSL